ncbi:MAG TPA: hypothetical protein V6C72_10335 [Chroococcales cyanobacterium]
MRRRRRGSTLSLIVLVFLLIVMNGVAAWFLITLFGGGREVANVTDAGTLNVAKQAVTVSVPVTNFPEFQDMLYPFNPVGSTNAPGITLLTYNRCVAKALIIAYNAKKMGSSQAIINAQHVIGDLNRLAAALKGGLSSPQGLYTNFNQANISVNNNTKMWGNRMVAPSSGSLSFMKANGPTNVFFNSQAVPDLFSHPSTDFNIPVTKTDRTPKNTVGAQAPTEYLPGYVDLQVNGVTGTGGPDTHIYGVPVFPQTSPHLVALADFLVEQKPVSTTVPPNAFRIDTKCQEQKTGVFGGAVACAIVGDAYSLTGGITGPDATIGNGMEFAAALPLGYIEFDNGAAAPLPPNYGLVQKAMDNNIFNNELGVLPDCAPMSTGYMYAGGDNGLFSKQNSSVVCFSQEPINHPLFYWIWQAKHDTELLWKLIPPTNSPPHLNKGIYVGPINTDLSNWGGPQPIHDYNALTDTQKKALAKCWSLGLYIDNSAILSGAVSSAGLESSSSTKDINCVNYLDLKGLKDYCVAAIGAMCLTFHRDMPPNGNNVTPANPTTNDFSMVDYAKGAVLADFMTPDNSQNAPGAPQGIGNNNPQTLTIPANMVSGIGVYNFIQNSNIQPVPQSPPDIPSPASRFPNSVDMPVQRIGSIYDTLRTVQSSACMQTTIDQIVMNCQQIQPKATRSDVIHLLQNTPFPMGTQGSGQPNQIFIYLKDANLAQPLIGSNTRPPGYAISGPDGTTLSGTCYSNTYNINQSIVDAGHDMALHIRPYTDVQGSLTATDKILYTMGSGYNNCLGKFQFQETANGSSTYKHIN